MATYTALITVYIEADDDQEAFDKYNDCDWDLDSHELFTFDSEGQKILVDESILEDKYEG